MVLSEVCEGYSHMSPAKIAFHFESRGYRSLGNLDVIWGVPTKLLIDG